MAKGKKPAQRAGQEADEVLSNKHEETMKPKDTKETYSTGYVQSRIYLALASHRALQGYTDLSAAVSELNTARITAHQEGLLTDKEDKELFAKIREAGYAVDAARKLLLNLPSFVGDRIDG